MKKWKYTDADFTSEQLAETVAWLIATDSDFDPLETEDLINQIRKEGEPS